MKKILILSFLFLIIGAPLLASAQSAVTPPSTGQSFVSISDVPGLGFSPSGTDIPNLTVFLQNLYNICIGIAVVLAVLQLIRGGITYMLGDSLTSVEEAKHLILISILGLVLVLSPFIVFSIINPAILSLNINTTGLQSTAPPATPAVPASPQATPQYGWVAQYSISSSQPGGGAANEILHGGPFQTSQECFTDAGNVSSKYPGHTVTLSQPPGFTCTCDTPTSAQGSSCQSLGF